MASDTPVTVEIEYRNGDGSPKDGWQKLDQDIKAKMGSAHYDILTPEQLSQSQSTTIQNSATQKNSNLVWTDSGVSDFSTTLFVDTSEVDPAEQQTKNAFTVVKVFKDKLFKPKALREGAKTLPSFRFKFSSFVYAGLLTKLDEKYIYFSNQGYPLRAEISFTVKKTLTPRESDEASNATESRAVRVVKAGDRLDIIADDYYGDPALWREIAAENNIQRPRLFPESADLGRELFLPDLASRR